jgi:hypothetical protein
LTEPQTARHIGKVRSDLDQIVVDNPRAQQAHALFEYLIAHGQQQGTGPKRCALLVGPSQSGKTTIIQSFAERKNTAEKLGNDEIPILVVPLRANISTKGLAQNILEKIGEYGYETGAHSGTENALLGRVHKLFGHAKVKLVVFDEFHHIAHIESRKAAWNVGETIKLFLIEGRCPVVLSGIEAAKAPFLENIQLSQRAEAPIELHRLDITNAEDRKLFLEFLKAYLGKVESVAGMSNVVCVLNREAVLCIHEVTQGVLGAACNLIKSAVCLALERGRNHLESDDLAVAADRCFILTGIYGRNPFRDGYGPIVARRAAA